MATTKKNEERQKVFMVQDMFNKINSEHDVQPMNTKQKRRSLTDEPVEEPENDKV